MLCYTNLRCMGSLFIICAFSSTLVGSTAFAQDESKQDESNGTKVESAELGNTKNVHQCGNLFLAGQFAKDDLDTIAENGIQRIITLRTDGEIKWDEKGEVKKRGLDFIEVPFRGPDTLDDKVFDKIRALLNDRGKKTMLHCGSANRVGGVWLAHRVMDQGVDFETALKEAKEVGLRNNGYVEKAKEYIERRSKVKSEDIKKLISGWKGDVKETEKISDGDNEQDSNFLKNFVPFLKLQVVDEKSGIIRNDQTEQTTHIKFSFFESRKVDNKTQLRARIKVSDGISKGEQGQMIFTLLSDELVQVILVDSNGTKVPVIVFRRDAEIDLDK